MRMAANHAYSLTATAEKTQDRSHVALATAKENQTMIRRVIVDVLQLPIPSFVTYCRIENMHVDLCFYALQFAAIHSYLYLLHFLSCDSGQWKLKLPTGVADYMYASTASNINCQELISIT